MIRHIRHRLRGYAKEAYHRLAIARRLQGVKQREPILVYQMGKVGSSTVVQTLEALGLPNPVLHVHTLDTVHLQRFFGHYPVR